MRPNQVAGLKSTWSSCIMLATTIRLLVIKANNRCKVLRAKRKHPSWLPKRCCSPRRRDAVDDSGLGSRRGQDRDRFQRLIAIAEAACLLSRPNANEARRRYGAIVPTNRLVTVTGSSPAQRPLRATAWIYFTSERRTTLGRDVGGG